MTPVLPNERAQICVKCRIPLQPGRFHLKFNANAINATHLLFHHVNHVNPGLFISSINLLGNSARFIIYIGKGFRVVRILALFVQVSSM